MARLFVRRSRALRPARFGAAARCVRRGLASPRSNYKETPTSSRSERGVAGARLAQTAFVRRFPRNSVIDAAGGRPGGGRTGAGLARRGGLNGSRRAPSNVAVAFAAPIGQRAETNKN
jgi:hypothetical protein